MKTSTGHTKRLAEEVQPLWCEASYTSYAWGYMVIYISETTLLRPPPLLARKASTSIARFVPPGANENARTCAVPKTSANERRDWTRKTRASIRHSVCVEVVTHPEDGRKHYYPCENVDPDAQRRVTKQRKTGESLDSIDHWFTEGRRREGDGLTAGGGGTQLRFTSSRRSDVGAMRSFIDFFVFDFLKSSAGL